MEQKQLFGLALGLHEPWFIDSLTFSPEQKRLDIHVDFRRGASFPVPGHAGTHKAHDTVEKAWRHLNFFQHECYLHCRTPRVKLESGQVVLVDPPFAGKSSGFTLLFEALLMQLLSAMPVAEVSRVVGESDDKLWRMLERYVDLARLEEDFSSVKAVGLDETSRRKGHDYITLFVDLEKRRTLYVAEGKDATTIPSFLFDFQAHGGEAENIERLSMDMSPAFIAGAERSLPGARITFDRFHIMKLLNDAVDEVRRAEVRDEPLLRKARYVLLKNRENMTESQRKHREVLDQKGFRLKSYRAMRMREYFQEAYKETTLEGFREHLYKWYWWASHSRIQPMMGVARTIRKNWLGVLAWVKNRDSNGILEGLNSLVQAAKAKARGYRTLKNMKLITYLVTGKLNFARVNPVIVT
ncbi:MAG TPA: ISL3 family transposase [Fibrobacteria bacterium]|nr:ISL3 family transposase [Fibrobacteria bacterium]